MNDSKRFDVSNVSCNHCVAKVKNAATSVDGVEYAEFNMSEKAIYVAGDFDNSAIIAAIEEAGYPTKLSD